MSTTDHTAEITFDYNLAISGRRKAISVLPAHGYRS